MTFNMQLHNWFGYRTDMTGSNKKYVSVTIAKKIISIMDGTGSDRDRSSQQKTFTDNNYNQSITAGKLELNNRHRVCYENTAEANKNQNR